MNLPITSREYKLMLDASRFEQRQNSVATFWTLVSHLATKQGGKVAEMQDEVEERRTWYLDTPEQALHQRGYSLRIRRAGKHQVTLKYRSSDRYLAAACDVSSTLAGKTKFEEDVLPQQSKFAHSNSVQSETMPALATVHQASLLFPGLQRLNIAGDTPLQRVGDFTAHEIVYRVGKIKFGGKPVVKACLSFWYLDGISLAMPLAVEFSFDYDLPGSVQTGDGELEQFPLSVVAGATQLFRTLQKYAVWLDSSGSTKTDFAYRG
ncbi:MAG: hypothetical protein DCC55_15530 [Chloroflexi bacterium]|nr:MAG: hypothetical protein DCC55_15530 [Chloroflexota bacterium]